MPGASRSIAPSVASGVTSRGATPVPPVVRTSAGLVGEIANRRFDVLALVGHDPAHHLVTLRREQLLERVAALVLALAGRDAVGNGEHRGFTALPAGGSVEPTPPVFSSNFTSSMTISLSTAFAMSYTVSAATDAAVSASISTPVCAVVSTVAMISTPSSARRASRRCASGEADGRAESARPSASPP